MALSTPLPREVSVSTTTFGLPLSLQGEGVGGEVSVSTTTFGLPLPSGRGGRGVRSPCRRRRPVAGLKISRIAPCASQPAQQRKPVE
jgi:hypothetical protein